MESYRKTAAWALALRGILFLAFGILSIFNASIESAISDLAWLFLIIGCIYFLLSFFYRKTLKAWWLGLIWGVVDLFIGGYMLLNVLESSLILSQLMGIFALLMGISILVAGIFMQPYRIVLLINSTVSISFGIVLMRVNPNIIQSNFLIGLYSLLLGAFILYVAYLIYIYKKSVRTEPQ